MVFYEGEEPKSQRTAFNPHSSQVERQESPMNNLIGSVGPTSLGSQAARQVDSIEETSMDKSSMC